MGRKIAKAVLGTAERMLSRSNGMMSGKARIAERISAFDNPESEVMGREEIVWVVMLDDVMRS